MLRIGRIEYANCTPIFEALQALQPSERHYRLVGGVPAKLNELLHSGGIDVCPSSSIEYARHAESYCIIPELSISSCGPVQSVLLFSTVPIEELDGQQVLLSSESATSVNLLRILLQIRYGLSCTYSVTSDGLNDSLRQAPAVLLIGDPALRAHQAAPEHLHVYDLGELWFQWTGKPFVFALWLASRETCRHSGSEMYRFVQSLMQAKQHALGHLDQIATASPDAAWMGRERLLTYWQYCISYDLTADHILGLKLFFQYARELGLVGAAPEPFFWSSRLFPPS